MLFLFQDVQLAHLFESLVKEDRRFEIVGEVKMAIVCFRMKVSTNFDLLFETPVFCYVSSLYHFLLKCYYHNKKQLIIKQTVNTLLQKTTKKHHQYLNYGNYSAILSLTKI